MTETDQLGVPRPAGVSSSHQGLSTKAESAKLMARSSSVGLSHRWHSFNILLAFFTNPIHKNILNVLESAK